LKSLITKTAGVVDVLRAALEPLAGRISMALLYGSVARGGLSDGAFEKTTTTTTGTFDSEVLGSEIKAANSFAFEADLKKLTYNVRIRVSPYDGRERLKLVRAVEIERSKYGHGDLPTHETPAPVTKMVSVNSVLMPEV
jgi:hypothetical protein